MKDEVVLHDCEVDALLAGLYPGFAARGGADSFLAPTSAFFFSGVCLRDATGGSAPRGCTTLPKAITFFGSIDRRFSRRCSAAVMATGAAACFLGASGSWEAGR